MEEEDLLVHATALIAATTVEEIKAKEQPPLLRLRPLYTYERFE